MKIENMVKIGKTVKELKEIMHQIKNDNMIYSVDKSYIEDALKIVADKTEIISEESRESLRFIANYLENVAENHSHYQKYKNEQTLLQNAVGLIRKLEQS